MGTDFLCVATATFLGAAFRVMVFFGTRAFSVTFFLTATFLLGFLFRDTFAFALLRGAAFSATALFAFGRLVLAVVARLFVTDFADERRATARDVERLRLLVTALISA